MDLTNIIECLHHAELVTGTGNTEVRLVKSLFSWYLHTSGRENQYLSGRWNHFNEYKCCSEAPLPLGSPGTAANTSNSPQQATLEECWLHTEGGPGLGLLHQDRESSCPLTSWEVSQTGRDWFKIYLFKINFKRKWERRYHQLQRQAVWDGT